MADAAPTTHLHAVEPAGRLRGGNSGDAADAGSHGSAHDSAAGGALNGAARNGAPQDELAALVVAAADGDATAFEALVSATYRDVFTLARRLTGDDEDARDVTQEAYLRAYRGLAGFRGDSMFSTWMYRVTANCAATYLGRRSRHRHESLPAAEVADVGFDGDPEAHVDAADTRQSLLVALDALPPKLRAVVVLRDVYELPHEVIGEELGISAAAAKVRLHRARKRLRAELHPELDGVESRAL